MATNSDVEATAHACILQNLFTKIENRHFWGGLEGSFKNKMY